MFAATVPRAQLCRRLVNTCQTSKCTVRSPASSGRSRTFCLRLESRGKAFAKQRHADDTQICRSTGACRISVWRRSEFKGRDFGITLAPSRNLVALPRCKHITDLIPGSRVAGDDIYTVNRGNRVLQIIEDLDKSSPAEAKPASEE